MQVFDLTPAARATPVIVEVPHAGLALPEQVRGEFAAPHDCITRDADIYVDKLYEHTPRRGATLLTAKVSRYVVDLNRAPDDVDPLTVPDHPSPKGVQPRGVVWRMTTDGRPALKKPLTYQSLLARLEQFHTPYHDALRAELSRTRARHGFAILVAGHSMPSVGRTGHADPGVRRADVVPGTRGRTTADPRVIEVVDAHFRSAGLSVRHDDPYKGGWTTGYYGRPAEGWHAIQIELNRALYVDEETGEPKRGDFERVQALLEQLVEKLAAIDLAR
jgi:N-formylglutamate deformylase